MTFVQKADISISFCWEAWIVKLQHQLMNCSGFSEMMWCQSSADIHDFTLSGCEWFFLQLEASGHGLMWKEWHFAAKLLYIPLRAWRSTFCQICIHVSVCLLTSPTRAAFVTSREFPVLKKCRAMVAMLARRWPSVKGPISTAATEWEDGQL